MHPPIPNRPPPPVAFKSPAEQRRYLADMVATRVILKWGGRTSNLGRLEHGDVVDLCSWLMDPRSPDPAKSLIGRGWPRTSAYRLTHRLRDELMHWTDLSIKAAMQDATNAA